MRRVILILLTLMLLMFFTDYIINGGVIFFNIYVWLIIALLSLTTSTRAIKSGPNLYEKRYLHMTISYVLLAASIACLVFIIILAVTRPYLL